MFLPRLSAMMLLWCLSAFAVAAQSELLQEPYSRPAYSHTLTGILGDAAEESTCALVQRRTSRSGHSTSPTSLAPSIPAVLHQSWKDTSVPQHLSEYKSTWQIVHPGWMYKFFTDDDNAELWKESSKETFTFYESLSEPVMRADASRLLYMKHFGGVYADLDVEPCQNMDRLLRRWQLIFVRSPRVFVSNFFIASTAGHPFWDFAMHELGFLSERYGRVRKHYGRPLTGQEKIMWTAGPRFLDEALTNFMKKSKKEIKDKIKIYDFEEWHTEMGVHHWTGTWHCPRGEEETCNETSKFAVKPTEGEHMGVDAAKACSAVPRHSLAELSGRTIMSSRQSTGDLCFVHVGKSGGEAVWRGLKKLRQQNKIRYLVQVHRHSNRTHKRKDQNETWPGPVIGSTRTLCAGTGAILLWLRDPVTRFISSWNFFANPPNEQRAQSHTRRFADLRSIVIANSLNRTALAEDRSFLHQLDLDTFVTDLFSKHNASTQVQVLDEVNYATSSLSWYFADCDAYNLATMPIAFVGAQESMQYDWKRLLEIYDAKVELLHSHATKQSPHKLSSFAVKALRKFYAKDFACISKLVDANRVSAEYLVNITSDSNVYRY